MSALSKNWNVQTISGEVPSHKNSFSCSLLVICGYLIGWVDTDRQTDRQTHRQTDRHAHIHTDGRTDRQTGGLAGGWVEMSKLRGAFLQVFVANVPKKSKTIPLHHSIQSKRLTHSRPQHYTVSGWFLSQNSYRITYSLGTRLNGTGPACTTFPNASHSINLELFLWVLTAH
jgi:hypothetical protein